MRTVLPSLHHLLKALALTAGCLLAAPSTAQIQPVVNDSLDVTRTVTNAQMVAFGAANILDTYLSPEKYKGVDMRYITHTLREYPGRKWAHQLIHEGSFASGNDRNEKNSMMAGYYHFNFAKLRGWRWPDKRLTIRAGGMADFIIGGTYNASNQNNPAQLRFSMALGATASAEYGFHMINKAFTLRYELAVPLIGLMFSPNYGQTYYEIFSLGHKDHNIVGTTPFCAPSMRQMLALDTHFRRTTLRIGYLGDYQQAEVNNLKQHFYTHALVIGLVHHFHIKNISSSISHTR
jgi:hypothetical protein